MATEAPKKESSEYLSVRQVADLLGVTTRTIWKLSAAKQFPAPVRLTPRLPRWKRAEIDAHIELLVTTAN